MMESQEGNSPPKIKLEPQIKLENNNEPDESAFTEESSISTDDQPIISNTVKLRNEPIVIPEKKRKYVVNPDILHQRAHEREAHRNEVREKSYKGLMHLLDKSKFYSKFLLTKIEKETESVRTSRKRSLVENNENIPPKNNKLLKSPTELKDDIRKSLSPGGAKKLRKGRQKLSSKEVGAELDDSPDTNLSDSQTSTESLSTETPKSFNGNLYEYQKQGFHWLKVLYENGLNGILADEMGLGKTVQVIVLICHLLEKKQPGPYLIVAPLSTLPNWVLEFERFAPDVPVFMLHAPEQERIHMHHKIRQLHSFGNSNFKTCPVVITSYDVPIRDVKYLRRENWRYIIVDEGQRLKNHESQLMKVLQSLTSVNRLLLTGTPLQNNLSELWSLLHFLLPEIFDNLAVFKSWFDISEMQRGNGTQKLLKQEEENRVISSLREILRPFMLRREKSDVNLQISRKKELVVYAPLTELQYDLYTAIVNWDMAMLSKTKAEPEIIPDIDGKRPRRRCTIKHVYPTNIRDHYDQSLDTSSIDSYPSTSNDSFQSSTSEHANSVDNESKSAWKQSINTSDRNYDYLIRMTTLNRTLLYRKVVNHPYLIHWPLASDGLLGVTEDLVKASGKLLVLDAMLAKLKEQGHKVLLFSTMTQILDIIEDFLSLRTYRHVRLDGSTKLPDRKELIKSFNEDPDLFLFLISTRAGGVGLNLVGADTAIIYDSDWNPQVDIQAMARCHRIGQTRPVVIYRLCTKGTVDERIIARADAKRLLEKAVISKEGRGLNVRSKETLLKLKELLEAKDYQVVTSENDVFSEKELNKLLDRSDLLTDVSR